MKARTLLICSTALVFVVTSCASGEREADTTWYRGNLHTHSFWSDGDDFPESILTWYRDNGYDFVAISDHNTIADGEKWMEAGPEDQHRRTVERYVTLFDEEWVEAETSGDTIRVRLKTFEEYSERFNDEGSFLVIRSEEISDRAAGKPIHVNATNVQSKITPQGGQSVVDVMQNNVDAVLHQRDSLGVPVMPHINHPNFGWAVRAEELAAVEGEKFFEVYNGHPAVKNNGDSLRMGTERMWDVVNAIRLTEDRPLMYGIAVDDAHNYQEIAMNRANVGRGWVVVRATDLSPEALIDGLESGRFYASTGVELESVTVENALFEVHVAEEEGVDYVIEFIATPSDIDMEMETVRGEDGSIVTTTFDEGIGQVVKRVEGTEASFQLTNDMLYVRARVISSRPKRNPFAEGEVERAWTQPVRK